MAGRKRDAHISVLNPAEKLIHDLTQLLFIAEQYGHIKGFEEAGNPVLSALQTAKDGYEKFGALLKAVNWQPPEPLKQAERGNRQAMEDYNQGRQRLASKLSESIRDATAMGIPIDQLDPIGSMAKYLTEIFRRETTPGSPDDIAGKGYYLGEPLQRAVQYLIAKGGTQVTVQHLGEVLGVKSASKIAAYLKKIGLACGEKGWVGIAPAIIKSGKSGNEAAAPAMHGGSDAKPVKTAKAAHGQRIREALSYAVSHGETIGPETIIEAGIFHFPSEAKRFLARLEERGYVTDGSVTPLGRKYAGLAPAAGKPEPPARQGKRREKASQQKRAGRGESMAKVLTYVALHPGNAIDRDLVQRAIPGYSDSAARLLLKRLERGYAEDGRLTEKGMTAIGKSSKAAPQNTDIQPAGPPADGKTTTDTQPVLLPPPAVQSVSPPGAGTAAPLTQATDMQPAVAQPVSTPPIVGDAKPASEQVTQPVKSMQWDHLCSAPACAGSDELILAADELFGALPPAEQNALANYMAAMLMHKEGDRYKIKPGAVKLAEFLVDVAGKVAKGGDMHAFCTSLGGISPDDAAHLEYHLYQAETKTGSTKPIDGHDPRLENYYARLLSQPQADEKLTAGIGIMTKSGMEPLLLGILGPKPDGKGMSMVKNICETLARLGYRAKAPAEFCGALERIAAEEGYMPRLESFLALMRDYARLPDRALKVCGELCTVAKGGVQQALAEYRREIRGMQQRNYGRR